MNVARKLLPKFAVSLSYSAVTAVLLVVSGVFFSAALPASKAVAASPQSTANGRVNLAHLLVDLLKGDGQDPSETLRWIDANWRAGMLPMVIESLGFAQNPEHRRAFLGIIKNHTGQDFGADFNAWYRWWWSQPEQRHADYAEFKSLLYRNIDPKFAAYFSADRATKIRLDEIRWGGVVQDGIPPLRNPAMTAADEADYLSDTDVVFGVEFDGDARAYPKRILAWHEMFTDTIGGKEYAGVYCTLCGAVIMYETEHAGQRYALGTSGFLYRSNKLMYDEATQSLWNTTYGEPVVGPLTAGQIRLQRSYIVTSTWGEWRRRHPDSKVLSLQTGHRRNYDEGAAYKEYFGTDSLMFTVPKLDKRLPNKAEILALTFPELSDETMALGADFLLARPIYHESLGGQEFVVLTDPSGANRVYAADALTVVQYDGDVSVTDDTGMSWTMTEAGLRNTAGKLARRLPAHRAFWFGWYAAHNDTRLIK